MSSGVGRSHLTSLYSEFPDVRSHLKFGHVIHLTHILPSRAAVVDRLMQLFHPSQKNEVTNYVRRTTDGVAKFKKLTAPTEFQLFASKCNEACTVPLYTGSDDIPLDPQPSTSACSSEQRTASRALPEKRHLNKRSPVKTRRSCNKCSHLNIIADLQLKLKEARVNKAKRIWYTKRKNISVSRLNQTLKRKTEQVKNRDSELQKLKSASELVKVKQELASLKKKLQQRKAYKKRKGKGPENEDAKSRAKSLLAEINAIQSDYLQLQDELRDAQEEDTSVIDTKYNGKGYSPYVRLMVWDALCSNVPTSQVSSLISKISRRMGLTVGDMPDRSTIEAMARELGVLSDLQVADMLMTNSDCTAAFDATTQDGRHVNEIHFTNSEISLVAAVDELPGGTALDYKNHLCDTVINIAEVYCFFRGGSFADVHQHMIDNISNVMTDRCETNHAAVELVNEMWKKQLVELNCHLHPLDSLATKTRAALKIDEKERALSRKVFGQDCVAADVVLQLNKMRYDMI